MKKSELKQLIREVIEEIKSSNLTSVERKKISQQLSKYPVLGGNFHVSGPSKALVHLTKALDDSGFQLDMVTGDILLGDKGQRLLPFSRKPLNPNEEGAPVNNSRIAFAWVVTSVSPSNSLDKKFEVTTYVT